MIEIKNIGKRYGSNIILKDISFTIQPGECIGILGANGSGKTTLLSLVSGMNHADHGKILADGKVLSSSKMFSRYISYVPQENPLINELSAFDNLRLWYGGSKKELKAALNEGILKELGIAAFQDKIVTKMSGGMKKRLSIGIALLHNPKLLIMDEPSAALDLSGKYQIRKYIDYFTKQSNGCVLLVSHDYNELAICSKLFFLQDGLLHSISGQPTEEELIRLINENDNKSKEDGEQ